MTHRLRFWAERIILLGVTVMLVACSGTHTDETLTEREHAVSAQERFQPPPGWQWGSFINADHARLRFGWAAPPGASRAIVVILPGFADTTETYFETARELLAEGFTVWAMDWRGQGGSQRHLENPQKAYSLGFDHDVADLAQFVTAVVQNPARQKILIAAESMGGHLVLRFLHDYPDLASAAALSSPAIEFYTPPFPTGVARVLTRLGTTLGLGEAYAAGQGDWTGIADPGGPSDRETQDRDRALSWQTLLKQRPELRLGGATYRFVDEFFKSIEISGGNAYLGAIRTPVLMGQTPTDQLVIPEAIERACTAMPHCTLLRLPGARHSLFHEADPYRADWIKAMMTFFAEAQ